MAFSEYLPAPELRTHILCYWMLTTSTAGTNEGMRIYADGCADIICNAGTGRAFFHPLGGTEDSVALLPGHLYLGGTMTAYGVLHREPGCVLTGIRFLPGGFFAHFRQPMKAAVDSTIELAIPKLCGIMQDTTDLSQRLDAWFADQASPDSDPYDFAYVRRRLHETGGLTSVEEIAAELHISQKTLERLFAKNVGISPKAFLRIARFQELLRRLQGRTEASLLQTAFELGFYDHAHLTKEFKKYAGVLPSELSNFYKTGSTGELYF